MNNIRMLNGYVTVYKPDHPRALKGTGYEGYVYQHILVAEEMLNRSLTSKEVVHHLDFNKANNAYTNLLVLEQSQHAKLHNWLSNGAPGWARVDQKEPRKKENKCLHCSTSLVNTKCTKYCSKSCSAKARKK